MVLKPYRCNYACLSVIPYHEFIIKVISYNSKLKQISHTNSSRGAINKPLWNHYPNAYTGPD